MIDYLVDSPAVAISLLRHFEQCPRFVQRTSHIVRSAYKVAQHHRGAQIMARARHEAASASAGYMEDI